MTFREVYFEQVDSESIYENLAIMSRIGGAAPTVAHVRATVGQEADREMQRRFLKVGGFLPLLEVPECG